MEKKIDLHVHTTASDGTFTPAEVIRLASETRLAAVAITDHDTVSGYQEAAALGQYYGIEVVPGIEISTRFHGAVHILGYFIDLECAELKEELSKIVSERDRRNQEICRMMQEDGLPVHYEEMKSRFGEVIGRPHFAKILVELGYAESEQESFRKYMEKGQRYFQRRTLLSIERSIDIICISGGIPVLAHPFQYMLGDAGLRELIVYCKDLGLLGMECFYSGYSIEQSDYLKRLAAEYGLLVTGGSDFHGSVKPHIKLGTGTGSLQVPYTLLDRLRENAAQN